MRPRLTLLLFVFVASVIGLRAAPPDKQVPTTPTSLVASAVTTTGFTVSWSASTDNVAVTGYELFLGGISQGTATTTSKVLAGLQPGMVYAVTVRARDAAANWSSQSSALGVTTVADTSPPTVPTALIASNVTAAGFTLSWTASTDNTAVTGYEIFLGGVSQGVIATTSKAFTGLSSGTTYSLTVRARDATGNWSAPSGALSVTTSAAPAGPYSFSAGPNDAIIAKSDGTVWAWGRMWGASPVRVSNISTVKFVAAGGYHALFVQQDGTVLATGDNSYGQIADGTLATAITRFTGVSSVAAGRFHSLAVKSDGTLYGWGDNEYGQVGNGKTTNVSSPAKLSQIVGIVQVAAGQYHSLALKSDGTVLAWGNNADGEVGNGTTTIQKSRVVVSGLTGVIAIAAGATHSLALKGDGTVWAWGDNSVGQIGDGTDSVKTRPVQVAGLVGVASVGGGLQHSVARKTDGTLWAWGGNAYRQLGDGTSIDRWTPVRVTILNAATKILAGGNASFAVMADGTIRSWGSFAGGMLGDGGSGVFSAPLDDVAQISAPSFFSMLLLRRNGTVWAWGSNEQGELGDGTLRSRYEAQQVQGLSGVVQLDYNMALRSDGSVYTWGPNTQGELGNGTTDARLTPGLVPGLTGVAQIAAGSGHCLALKSDGTVWAWGLNTYGQIGDGTVLQRNAPVQVPGLSNVVWIAAGGENSFAVKSDGSVWSWGYDWWISGTGTGKSESVPTRALVDGVTQVSSNGRATLFLTNTGTLYICGEDDLGVGPWYGTSIPLAVPGLTNIVEIAVESSGKTARAADGSVWAWVVSGAVTQIQIVPGIANPSQLRSASSAGLVYLDGKAILWAGPSLRPAGFLNLATQVANLRLVGSALDTDNDGLPDDWETQQFGNLSRQADADGDGDGLTNVEEYLRGTNPSQANGDGDSFPDGVDEFPVDYYNQTAPVLGIVDGNNRSGTVGQFNPNPFDLAVWSSDGFRPLIGAPVTFAVFSGGGLLATSSTGSVQQSSSLNLLTDADGTAQAYYRQPSTAGVASVIQASAGLAQVIFNTTSVALIVDSDGDGLTDSEEAILGTNPNSADTDGDGSSDFAEYRVGRNPLAGVLPGGGAALNLVVLQPSN